MAGKKTVKGAKKSSPKKTAKKPGAVKSSPKKSKDAGINMVPVYVLCIMGLLAVLVIVLNNKAKNPERQLVTKETAVKIEKKTVREEKKEDIKAEKDIPIKEKEKIITEKTDSADNKEFQIYLVKFNQKNDKMTLSPVKRKGSGELLQGALNELIKGPNKTEKKQGLLTAIPSGLKLRSVQVVGKNAVLDFNSAIEEEANGEILLTRIDQLVYTATQFSGIENVIIKVNGKQKKFLGGEGLSVSGPLNRKGAK